MKSTLFLCGAGNPEGVRLAVRVNERERRWERLVLLDDDPAKKGTSILGIDIVGPFDLLQQADAATCEVVNLVARTTTKRHAAYDKIRPYGIPFTSMIDGNVDTWGVEWRGDVTIYQGVVFSAGAILNEGSVIFTGAVLGHRCSVGKWCILAPGAVLNARVVLQDGVYVGTNASVLPDLKIGAWATIGVNSGVVEDIPAGATALGVPAQILRCPSPAGVVASAPTEIASPKVAGIDGKEIEADILDIWRRTLNIAHIGTGDNFFQLGGTSALAVRAQAELKLRVDQELTIVDLFQYPTVAALAAVVVRRHAPASDSIAMSGLPSANGGPLFARRVQARMKSRGAAGAT